MKTFTHSRPHRTGGNEKRQADWIVGRGEPAAVPVNAILYCVTAVHAQSLCLLRSGGDTLMFTRTPAFVGVGRLGYARTQ